MFPISDLNFDEIASDVNFDTRGPFDVYIGNRELMNKQTIIIPHDVDQMLREQEEKGKTGVFVTVNGEIFSCFSNSKSLLKFTLWYIKNQKFQVDKFRTKDFLKFFAEFWTVLQKFRTTEKLDIFSLYFGDTRPSHNLY